MPTRLTNFTRHLLGADRYSRLHRDIFPRVGKQTLKVLDRLQEVTGIVRVLPDFLIIGASKSGSTSFYYYLTQHPHVYAALRKETQYFMMHYRRSLRYYRSFFPTIFTKRLSAAFSTGEASIQYFVREPVIKRVAETLPDVRLIVLLRNPIDRAYSHYQYLLRTTATVEPTFEDAIQRDYETLQRTHNALLGDQDWVGAEHFNGFPYLLDGHYADALTEWFRHYPRKQFLILKAEDFFADPKSVLAITLDFLGITDKSTLDHIDFTAKNVGGYSSEIEPETLQRLREYFAPHNQRLYDLLGRDFGWD